MLSYPFEDLQTDRRRATTAAMPPSPSAKRKETSQPTRLRQDVGAACKNLVLACFEDSQHAVVVSESVGITLRHVVVYAIKSP
jgi:hypothetical protein